jgi:hypothetical protein
MTTEEGATRLSSSRVRLRLNPPPGVSAGASVSEGPLERVSHPPGALLIRPVCSKACPSTIGPRLARTDPSRRGARSAYWKSAGTGGAGSISLPASFRATSTCHEGLRPALVLEGEYERDVRLSGFHPPSQDRPGTAPQVRRPSLRGASDASTQPPPAGLTSTAPSAPDYAKRISARWSAISPSRRYGHDGS